jgi:tape measure domain-containing protein
MADSRVLEIILRLKDEASKQLSQVDSFLQKNASNFQMVGAAITGAGLSLGLVTKQFVGAAAQVEQTEIAFSTMLGSVQKAKQFYADLVNFARKTPFELTGLSNAAKQLLAYGFAQEEVLPNLRALGDIAAGVGMDKLPNLILAFGQVRAATKLTGMELRQFTEAGVPLLDELSKMLGKPVAAIQEMVSAGEIGFPLVQQALMNLTGEGGRFANLMDQQSKSFSGLMSNLKDQIAIFLAEGGKPLLDVGKQIIAMVADVVSRMNEWAQKHPELTKLIGITTAAMTALFLIIGPIITVLGIMAAAASALGLSLGALALTIGLVPLAIAGLIAAGYLLITNWELVKTEAKEIWGTVKEVIISVWTSIKDFFIGVWDEIKNTFKGAIDPYCVTKSLSFRRNSMI